MQLPEGLTFPATEMSAPDSCLCLGAFSSRDKAVDPFCHKIEDIPNFANNFRGKLKHETTQTLKSPYFGKE